MAFSFGAQPATSTTPSFGGGFGSNTAGSFGSTAPAPASNTFSFGGSSAAPASSTAPSFGFGAGNTAPATSTASGFGFGANASATSTAPAPSFGGFGAANTATSQPANTTGLFGSTQGTGGFGTNTSQPSMFGSNTAATSSAPSMFGSNTTATSTAPSLFGSNTATSAPSLFGSNTAATSTAPSLFGGASNTTSLFGNTSGTSLFGSNAAKPGLGGGMFGGQQQQPTIGANANAQQQQNQQVWQYLSQQEQSAQQLNQRLLPGQHTNPQYIWQSLALIKSEWDPNSPNCKFKHYFYNIVHPSEVQRFTKPPNEEDKAWEMAMKNNPDPTCMVPVRAVGFEALRTRIETQDRQCQAHKIKLEMAISSYFFYNPTHFLYSDDEFQQLEQKIKEVRRKHNIETVVKLQEYKRRHVDLTQRVIQFLKYAQILRNKGFSIENEEETLRSKLETVQSRLQQSDQFHGKLNQLWAQLQLVRESSRIYDGQAGDQGWSTVSEKDMATISKVLEEQQAGLAHVMNILREDLQDTSVLSQALSEHSK